MGVSADEVAQRKREQAQKLLSSAQRWEQGADGERRTAESLATLPEGWFVLNDVRWPHRARANIDHVVVGPPGVYVIDSKSWSGDVRVIAGSLRQNGRDRSSALKGAAAASEAIAQLVPEVRPHDVHAVLAFAGQARAVGVADGVLICPVEQLATMLNTRKVVFATGSAAGVFDSIDVGLRRIDRKVVPTGTVVTGKTGPCPNRKKRRDFSFGRLVKPALAAGFFGVMVTQPQVITQVTDPLATLFSSVLIDSIDTEPALPQPAEVPERPERPQSLRLH